MKSIQALLLAAVLTVSAAAAGCSDTKSHSSVSGTESEAMSVSPEDIVFKWQKSYQEKLEDVKSADSAYDAFDLLDLTGNGTPELIISQGTDKTSVCEIYTYSNETLTLLGTAGYEGVFDFLPESGLIREEYHGDGFILGKFLKFDNGSLTDFLTYSDNSESATAGATIIHKINGEEKLLPEYEAALAPYVGSLTFHLGRKFTLGDASVNYAIRRGESWGAVLNKKSKQLFRKKLIDLTDTLGKDNPDAAFEFCDLNGDDVPELIVSSGSATDSQCSIYCLNGEELSEIEGTYGRYGRLLFDVEALVFYSESETGFTYWSLADSSFSADSYESSGSVMEVGRKYPLNATGIEASLV